MNRKRATKACLSCRKRKVRCDVTRIGRPCTNCRLDEADCSVIPRAPRVMRREDGTEVVYRTRLEEPLIPSDEEPCEIIGESSSSSRLIDDNAYDLRESEDSPQTTSSSATNTARSTSGLDSLGFKSESQPELHSELHKLLAIEFDQTVLGDLFEGSVDLDFHEEVKVPWTTFRPASAWHNESHLQSRGCFRIPCNRILAEFFHSYFFHVHPLLPMLIEADVWAHFPSVIGENISEEQNAFSLLLLQAMLFVSCNFIPVEILNELGFDNTRAAKSSFYRTCQLLYDHSSPTDHDSMAKAALLLTYGCPSIEVRERELSSTWLAIAIHHAMETGANNYQELVPDLGMEPQAASIVNTSRNSLKRLWWCCIIRDRIISLTTRRSAQISPRQLSLVAADPLRQDDICEDSQYSKTFDENMEYSMALVLSSLVEICINLTDVLDLMYPVQEQYSYDTHTIDKRVDLVRNHRRQLKSIYNKLVHSLPLEPSATGESIDKRLKKRVFLSSCVIMIYYQSAFIALYNCELQMLTCSILVQSGGNRGNLSLIVPDSKELWDSIITITSSTKILLRLGLVRWLPNSIVSCMALPLSLHILELKLSLHDNPASSEYIQSHIMEQQDRLNVLVRTMKELQSMYDGVDWVSKIIRYFMECTYFDNSIPQNSEPALSLQQEGSAPIIGQTARAMPTRNPACYLRMAMTLDLSLRRDRLPEENDFPHALRGLMKRTGCFMPIFFGQSVINTLDIPGDLVPAQTLSGSDISASPSYCNTGWIENDRSLYFAREMGLFPCE